jgi:hypothetical protein
MASYCLIFSPAGLAPPWRFSPVLRLREFGIPHRVFQPRFARAIWHWAIARPLLTLASANRTGGSPR